MSCSSAFSFGTTLVVFVLWLRLWGGVGNDDGGVMVLWVLMHTILSMVSPDFDNTSNQMAADTPE